jgi:hypothetical protein
MGIQLTHVTIVKASSEEYNMTRAARQTCTCTSLAQEAVANCHPQVTGQNVMWHKQLQSTSGTRHRQAN